MASRCFRTDDASGWNDSY